MELTFSLTSDAFVCDFFYVLKKKGFIFEIIGFKYTMNKLLTCCGSSIARNCYQESDIQDFIN